MAPRTTHLRESEQTTPRRDSPVIDAKFTVVAGRKSGWVQRTFVFLLALACAAAIGFLIPPAWVVLQNILAVVG